MWFLGAAIASEVTGSLSLKAALGNPLWYLVVAVGFLAAFTFLSPTLRNGMPLGVAYGIRGASGVTLTAVLSALIFHEPLTPLMIGGVVAIVLGVLIIEIGSQRAANHTEETS